MVSFSRWHGSRSATAGRERTENSAPPRRRGALHGHYTVFDKRRRTPFADFRAAR